MDNWLQRHRFSNREIKVLKTKARNHRFKKIHRTFEKLAVITFETLDGHTTDKKSKWRYFTICLGALVIALIDSWQLYYKKGHGYTQAKLESTAPDAMQSIYDYFQYLVDLYHIHMYDRNMCADYYRQYMIIDDFLGRVPNAKINSELNRSIWGLIIIWLTNVTYTSFCNRQKGIFEMLIHGAYHVFLLTKILTVLSLIAHTLRIEYRLRMIGDVVEHCYKMCEDCFVINVLNECRTLSARIYNSIYPTIYFQRVLGRQKVLMQYRTFPKGFYNKIMGLTKCYLILTQQCEFVNNMFAVRYDGIVTAQYGPVLWSLMRSFVPAMIFFSLVLHCERAYREHDRIVRLADHVIIGKSCDNQVLEAVRELRRLAASRPISFTAANFFRFEYPIVTTIIATVTNYSIILFQSKSS